MNQTLKTSKFVDKLYREAVDILYEDSSGATDEIIDAICFHDNVYLGRPEVVFSTYDGPEITEIKKILSKAISEYRSKAGE